jgi:hypothetical protein
MKPAPAAFRKGRASDWTRERLAQLGRDDLVNLQANAARLAEPELEALCAELLKERPRRATGPKTGIKARRNLMPRGRAFAAHGVWLVDERTSWSGIRKIDGMVVLALWQAAVVSQDGGCSYLLWAPNVDGARPWSDTPAGRERLEHCKVAHSRGNAEGLLVQGETLEGHLPEERARSVLGIDAETVVRFEVEKRGKEYWACWGKKRKPS